MTVMMSCTCGTSTSFLNCLEHEHLSLHTTGTTTLSKSCTWGIATESAQFALCVPVVLGARTAGACRCMKQRRQPSSKKCNSGNSTVFVLSGPTSPVKHSNGHVNTSPRTAPGPEHLSLHTTGQEIVQELHLWNRDGTARRASSPAKTA